MDDNERIELWAESVIFSEEFFARLQGDEDNPPDFLGAAMYLKAAFVDTSIAVL